VNFDLTSEQEMMRDSFARFLDDTCTPERLREIERANGHDPQLWAGLAELGAFMLRVPEDAGGLGLGTFDAVAALMEEVGRKIPFGPIAETVLGARLLALLGANEDLLAEVMGGEKMLTLALHDAAERPAQFVPYGAHAALAIARRGDAVELYELSGTAEPNLASTGIAEITFAPDQAQVLASGAEACAHFSATLEEWKLFTAATLSAIGRQSVKMAAEYATERKQFGQPIGQFQGVSHPLADAWCDVDGGRLLVWRTLRDLADGHPDAAANVSLTAWFCATGAAGAVSQALQAFGGYGLTTEYDIYLYNLRAKALALIAGDPENWLREGGRRRYSGETASLPDVGDVPIEFDIGEEARAMIAEIDSFMAANVTPEMRAQFHYSWEGFVPELHRKLADANLLFLGNPDMGGRAVGSYAKRAARKAFDRHGYNNPAAGVTEMVGTMIARYGTDEVKTEVLAKFTDGTSIASLGYSEPGAGSDVFAAQTRAIPDGNGWRIEGTKMFTSGANLADYVLMLTRTNTEVAKHKGLTMFMVPLKAEGVTIQPVYTFQDERTNITFYDNVSIPDSWRLGEVDGGVKTMSVALELEHGGGFGGVIAETLEAAEELAEELGLTAQEQAQARMARVHVHALVGEVLEFRAMWAGAEKKPNLAFGPMVKMWTSERFMDGARDLLDLTAPLSLTKRPGAAALVNQSYRHAHGTRIYGGTSEVHRSMIAERGLGMPRTRA
jgi:alkylation response protein AidB-like acyl-CoA dehydrogenase